MDLQRNVEKWTHFLSSIDTNTSSTNNSTIKTEGSRRCLSTILANKLKIKGIDSGNQPKTPTTKRTMPLGEAEDESIDNTNEPAGKRARHESIDDREGAEIDDDTIKEKPNIDETSQDTETPAGDSMYASYGVDIVRSTDRDQPEASIEENTDVDHTGDTKMPVDDVSIIVNQRERDTLTPSKKTKNNMASTPSSQWYMSDIAQYLNFDDVVEIKMSTRTPDNLCNIYEMVQKDICRLLKVVRGINLKGKQCGCYSAFLKQLIPITSIEAGSRLVLDALLVSLCSVLCLQFEVEKKIKYKDLPSCTYDYCIRKGERIIGCIETKHVNTLSETSIAQAILQVITLQKTLEQTETPEFNMSEFPVFAIVTDGHRFIYIQLRGSSLGFEHDRDKVRVREVTEYDDYKDIIQHIIFLVDEAVTPEF